MNQDNPYAMNQTCKVCGEPAAGFHFGAFTCEGCKSFFGRSYNNLSSISDCKNNGECIINKKNRTACKACRLRKCLMVGMSKSGSRYGRRSNWFKIHCLLQEQQQQAAAAMAAHQQHQAGGNAVAGGGAKPVAGVPPPTSAAAVAALGMLSHAAVSAYPRLYPGARSKDELIMLGLEDYVGAKHPAASPSVSSPDSHNSDSSVEANMHGNPLLHLGARSALTSAPSGLGGVSEASMQGTALGPQLRKDLPPFLPLSFPGLNSMPVMPPPPFLPASHLLFSGYHPALYPHHQALLKPTSEQQQAAAAAAAVQHLFNSSSVGGFGPTLPNAPAAPFVNKLTLEKDERTPTTNPKNDTINNNNNNNNNHLLNGSKSAQEATKRFYLNAVFKSQQPSPPPTATKLNAHSKHDHSISALVTPNSESGRERPNSHQSNVEIDELQDSNEAAKVEQDQNADSDCGEDLVVSMTPPCSPAQSKCKPTEHSQDNPIDLSMKTGGSVSSSISSKCSSSGSIHAGESDHELNDDTEAECYDTELEVAERMDEEEDSTTETVKTTIEQSKLNYNNNNNNNNNNKYTTSDTNEQLAIGLSSIKRKADEYAAAESVANNDKRMKLTMEAATIESPAAVKVNTVVLDLTSKV